MTPALIFLTDYARKERDAGCIQAIALLKEAVNDGVELTPGQQELVRRGLKSAMDSKGQFTNWNVIVNVATFINSL